MKNRSEKYAQLIEHGFCLFEDILTQPFVKRLSEVTTRLAETQNLEDPGQNLTQGSMVRTSADAMFAELIAWQPALDAIKALGFEHPTYTDGYVISKPPHSPALFWHYDWFAWQDPTAYDPDPQQVFLMYYLSDTGRENGCLRVIPGSHRLHNALHDVIDEPHSEELSTTYDEGMPAFSQRPDELDVPVKAGDLLIGDARLIHATHANASDERRTVITLWYQPRFDALPEPIKAQVVAKIQPLSGGWPARARALVEPLHPKYDGDARPYGRQLYRRKPE